MKHNISVENIAFSLWYTGMTTCRKRAWLLWSPHFCSLASLTLLTWSPLLAAPCLSKPHCPLTSGHGWAPCRGIWWVIIKKQDGAIRFNRTAGLRHYVGWTFYFFFYRFVRASVYLCSCWSSLSSWVVVWNSLCWRTPPSISCPWRKRTLRGKNAKPQAAKTFINITRAHICRRGGEVTPRLLRFQRLPFLRGAVPDGPRERVIIPVLPARPLRPVDGARAVQTHALERGERAREARRDGQRDGAREERYGVVSEAYGS